MRDESFNSNTKNMNLPIDTMNADEREGIASIISSNPTD